TCTIQYSNSRPDSVGVIGGGWYNGRYKQRLAPSPWFILFLTGGGGPGGGTPLLVIFWLGGGADTRRDSWLLIVMRPVTAPWFLTLIRKTLQPFSTSSAGALPRVTLTRPSGFIVTCASA